MRHHLDILVYARTFILNKIGITLTWIFVPLVSIRFFQIFFLKFLLVQKSGIRRKTKYFNVLHNLYTSFIGNLYIITQICPANSFFVINNIRVFKQLELGYAKFIIFRFV